MYTGQTTPILADVPQLVLDSSAVLQVLQATDGDGFVRMNHDTFAELYNPCLVSTPGVNNPQASYGVRQSVMTSDTGRCMFLASSRRFC